MKLSSAMWGAVVAMLTMTSAPVWAQPAAAEADTKTKTEAAADGDAAAKDDAAKDDAAKDDAKPSGDEAKPDDGAEADGDGDGAASDGGASGATASAQPVDGATYAVRLRDLEARIDELKEQIRRSHTRLSLLSDTILSGGVGGARAEIRFRNDMSGAFRLTRALFVLDGAVQYNKTDDTGALAEQKEIPIYTGSVPPGDHTLQVLLKLRGHGYGVFSYLRGYRFEVKSSHSFTVTEGKTIRLEAIAYEKGGVTTPLEERPAIRYIENVGSGGGGGSKPAASASGSRDGNKVQGGFSLGTGGN